MVESEAVTASDLQRTVETVWRMESAKIIASLTRLVRDVGVAEDLAHDALVAALEQWPAEGLPRNPAAWLMGTAKHRALDRLRREPMLERRHEQLGYEIETGRRDEVAALDEALDDEVGDDLLRLVFTACHPLLPRDGQIALTLRLLCGLTTDEIARAFLVPEPTIAQRIVRAKKTLANADVPFEVPRGEERAVRLTSVLSVVYLVFNEGYTATAGHDWMRPTLCQEALRLARVLSELAPGEPEVHGLAALLEFQASRLNARVDSDGRAVRLNDQDRATVGSAADRAWPACSRSRAADIGPPGPYALQAAIAACHATARTPADTNWPAIVALYDQLVRVTPSPIIELNRAVAVSMASGPQAGLDLVDALAHVPTLKTYHLVPAVRGSIPGAASPYGRSTRRVRASGCARRERARTGAAPRPGARPGQRVGRLGVPLAPSGRSMRGALGREGPPAVSIWPTLTPRADEGRSRPRHKEAAMKVMVIVKATKNSEAGAMPSEQLLAAMGNYNEELVKAGIMLAGEGLHPSVKAKRIKFSGGTRRLSTKSWELHGHLRPIPALTAAGDE